MHSAKVGGDIEKDIERVRHLEAERLPGERILYDVNRAWTRREASIVMNAVSDLGITVEQPRESLDDIAAIRPVTTTPISVDASQATLQDATRFAREGLADVFGIKLNLVGGLTKARRIRYTALAHGSLIRAAWLKWARAVLLGGGSAISNRRFRFAKARQSGLGWRRSGIRRLPDWVRADAFGPWPSRIAGSGGRTSGSWHHVPCQSLQAAELAKEICATMVFLQCLLSRRRRKRVFVRTRFLFLVLRRRNLLG